MMNDEKMRRRRWVERVRHDDCDWWRYWVQHIVWAQEFGSFRARRVVSEGGDPGTRHTGSGRECEARRRL